MAVVAVLLVVMVSSVAHAAAPDPLMLEGAEASVRVFRASFAAADTPDEEAAVAGAPPPPPRAPMVIATITVRFNGTGARADRRPSGAEALPGNHAEAGGAGAQLGLMGTVRLVCGSRLVESHPFPTPVDDGEPPDMLVPVGVGDTAAPWTGLQDVVRLADPAPAHEGQGVHRFALVLRTAGGRTSDALDASAAAALGNGPDASWSAPAAAEAWMARSCQLRYLAPRAQNLWPTVSVRAAPGRPAMEGAVRLARARPRAPLTTTAPAPARDGRRTAAWRRRAAALSRLEYATPERAAMPYWRCAAARGRGGVQDADEFGGGAAAAEAGSFLEMRTRAMAAMFEHVMSEAGNPLKSAFEPLAEPFAGELSSTIADQMDTSMLSKMTEGISEQLTQQLTERLVPSIAAQLPSSLAESVPAMVQEKLPRAVSERVTRAVTAQMTAPVTIAVTSKTLESVPRAASAEMPLEVVREVLPPLGPLLIKSISHAVAASLRMTLHHAAQSVRCWYCVYNERYYGFTTSLVCDDCRGGDAQKKRLDLRAALTMDGLYYSGYYSQYYGGYFSTSDWISIAEGVQNSQPKLDYWDGNAAFFKRT